MKKEEKIIQGFVREITLDGIGDMWCSADYDDGFYIEIESAHDVRHKSEDIYNIFKEYCEQYFSSQEWMDFLEGETVNFSSKYHDIVEEMDYDYHDTFLPYNLHVIKNDIKQEFQRYIDTHFEEIEEDYDDEDDALPILEMFAEDYNFIINIKTTSVFPPEWLLEKFNEDRKLKYSKEAAVFLAEYAERINRSRNADRNIYISDVKTDVGFLNITCAVYSDNKLDSGIMYFIRNLYESKDFKKLVKGGIFGPKIIKVVNKWNDLIYIKILQSENNSETWFNFKLDIREGVRKYAEELYNRGEINIDTRNEIYDTEIRYNLEYVDVIKEDELYYRVYEAREKEKKNKK